MRSILFFGSPRQIYVTIISMINIMMAQIIRRNKYQFNTLITNGTNNDSHIDHVNHDGALPIGIIKCYWKNNQDTISTYNYGTAFAITNNLIMTCTHNIYSERQGKFCSEVSFYPNPVEKLLQMNSYPSQPGQFYKCLSELRSFKTKPIKQEICLLVLNRRLQMNRFIQIGTIRQSERSGELSLSVCGYPSSNFQFDITKVKPEMEGHKGKIKSIEGDIINHDMSTKKGHSGSPLLFKNKDGNYIAVGVHTHKGFTPDHSCGVFFTLQILGMIKSFEKQLSGRYNLSGSIKYACDQQQMNTINQQAIEISRINRDESINSSDYQFLLDSSSNLSQYVYQSQTCSPMSSMFKLQIDQSKMASSQESQFMPAVNHNYEQVNTIYPTCYAQKYSSPISGEQTFCMKQDQQVQKDYEQTRTKIESNMKQQKVQKQNKLKESDFKKKYLQIQAKNRNQKRIPQYLVVFFDIQSQSSPWLRFEVVSQERQERATSKLSPNLRYFLMMRYKISLLK